MISRNLLFIIVMAASATFCYSNVDCVIEAFDSERQAVGMQQAADASQKSAEQALALKALSKSSAKGQDKLTWFEKGRVFVNDVFDIDDPVLKSKVSYAQITSDFLLTNTDYVSIEARHWINQQCLPYLDAIFRDLPRSLFLCTKLHQSLPQQVGFLASVKGFAFHPIGRLLKKAATASKPSAKSEIQKEKQVAFTSQLKNGREKIAEFHEDLFKKFQQEFLKEYSAFLQRIDQDKCKAGRSKRCSNFQASDSLTQSLCAINALIVNDLFQVNDDSCQIVRNVLTTHAPMLTESPSSLAFVRLGDMIVGRIKGGRSIVNLKANVLFPMCISAIIESGEDLRFNKLLVCNKLIESALTVQFSPSPDPMAKSFPIDILESPEYIRLFQDALVMAVNKVRKSGRPNEEEFTSYFLKTWTRLLQKPWELTLAYRRFSMYSGLAVHEQIPILISMADLLQASGADPEIILTPQLFAEALTLFNKALFTSTLFTDFIETFKTNTIKKLGAAGIDIKMTHFRRRLTQKCDLMPEFEYQEICREVARTIAADDYVHYRFLDFIFDLIVDRVSDELKKIIVTRDNVLEATALAQTGVANLLLEFADELREFTETKSELVALHTPVKAMMYLLVAKTVFMDTSERLPSIVYEQIANFIVNHSEALHRHKLRHFEFDLLMRKLQTDVASKTATSTALSKKMKGSQLAHTDDHIKAFAMTTEEKAQLRDDLAFVLRSFPYLSFTLQQRLDRCKISNSELLKAQEACRAKHSRDCTVINPFLLMVPCPSGWFEDPDGYCYAYCPDSFTQVGRKYCRKPVARLIQLHTAAHGTYSCPPGFLQEGVFCIPRCPAGWKSVGDVCERPSVLHNYSTQILLVN